MKNFHDERAEQSRFEYLEENLTDLAGNLRRKWVPRTEYLADLLKTDTNEQAPII